MAVFKCEKHPYLVFYIGGEFREFANGEYRTEDEKEIEALEKIPEVFRVDEPTAEEESETEAEGTKKPRRKTSAK